MTQQRQLAVLSSPQEPKPHRAATQCFSLRASHDPSVYPDVLGQLAKRGLTPNRLHGSHGRNNQELHIDFQVEDIDKETARAVAKNLRRLILVETVLVCEKTTSL